MTAPTGAGRADIEVRLPADNAYVAVLRNTAATLAARLDFTIDDIEDLKMAVGEASALALDVAVDGSDLTSGFHLGTGEMKVVVAVDSASDATHSEDSFGWQVLTTLAESVSADVSGGRFEVALSMRSALQDAAESADVAG